MFFEVCRLDIGYGEEDRYDNRREHLEEVGVDVEEKNRLINNEVNDTAKHDADQTRNEARGN